jgi:predicted dehydrogenase
LEERKIALIGAGELGSRHLQALALLDNPCRIYVIDPVEKSLEIADKRFAEVEGCQRHKLYLISALDKVEDKELDLVIIATNANIRRQIALEFLIEFKISYLILEKFLFQRLADYCEIENKLEETGTKCFVNCPRRMFPTYRHIHRLIRDQNQLHMEVVGNNWGLACNGIHFVDLFQWLSGEQMIEWDNKLDPELINSKRKGYIEYSGRIEGVNSSRKTINITSFNSGTINNSIRISTPGHRFLVAETFGKVIHERLDAEKPEFEVLDYSMLLQSQLTNKVATQLFDSGKCNLTPYSDSMEAHIPLLRLMLKNYNLREKQNSNRCPIT